MTTRVDGHSWALSAIDELKVDKIITPLNKDHIPITDSPVVVQQHMLPPKKFVLLSAQVCTWSLKVETKKQCLMLGVLQYMLNRVICLSVSIIFTLKVILKE